MFKKIKGVIKHLKNALITDPYKKAEYLRKKGAKIGKGTRFLSNTDCLGSEPYLVEIGEDCLISTGVLFSTHDGSIKVLHGLGKLPRGTDFLERIVVGNNCFIGARSLVLKGVKIGDNCIIGAGSVVTKDIPINSVAAGVPAKVICDINSYYEKVKDKTYPTAGMSFEEKKEYCETHSI